MGQFVVGNKAAAGRGRPKRTVELAYLARLSERVSLEDWERVIDRAIQDATSGDSTSASRAREWLARYLIGGYTVADIAPAIEQQQDQQLSEVGYIRKLQLMYK